jgi:aldehyde:ferredoxin oxidoreductase
VLTIREFNLREGIELAEDYLPEHFFQHPLGKKGLVLKDEEFTRLVRDYYEMPQYSAAGKREK